MNLIIEEGREVEKSLEKRGVYLTKKDNQCKTISCFLDIQRPLGLASMAASHGF